MKFLLTPEEAQPPAIAVARFLRRQQMTVRTEVAAWDDAPYRTTLVGVKSEFRLLVEAQGTLSYGKVLKEFAIWIAAKQHYSELYIATPSDSILQAGLLGEMKSDGVGLIVVDKNDQVNISQKSRNHAFVIRPHPSLKFGDCRVEVTEAVQKFNEVDRKDGLRDMCELVERETEALALRAVRAGWVKMSDGAVRGMDWSSQINMLASINSYNAGKNPVVSQTMKDDLHSFRGARNLVDHKVRNRREDTKRQKQFAERMLQGPRLVADLVTLQRKVK
jgi:hypothetical protein